LRQAEPRHRSIPARSRGTRFSVVIDQPGFPKQALVIIESHTVAADGESIDPVVAAKRRKDDFSDIRAAFPSLKAIGQVARQSLINY
jgi:hypothetical protein